MTVKGNQGTPFLQEVEKPFFTTRKELPLDKELSGSEALRALALDEILELIEGPRKVTYPDVSRAKVKAIKDGAIGWLTLKDKSEVEYAEVNKNMYTIKNSVAMTDGANIKECKVIRKLAEGEVFEIEGEAVEDPQAELTQVVSFLQDAVVRPLDARLPGRPFEHDLFAFPFTPLVMVVGNHSVDPLLNFKRQIAPALADAASSAVPPPAGPP